MSQVLPKQAHGPHAAATLAAGPNAPSDLLPGAGQERSITWRSVGLGLLGTLLICGLTPYNDFVLVNTFLVGNNLPLGLLAMTFLLTVFVNAPLSRWAPKYALSTGECAVAFSMVLVSCSIPSSALMRYFPSALVTPFWQARSNSEYFRLLDSLSLPAWLFPNFEGDRPRQWINDPIVTGFLGRWTGDGPPPYGAWVRPALLWGIYFIAFHGALMCLIAMVRRQWYENERLAFPLAHIELALIAQPKPGSWFNAVLSRPWFWICLGAVFLLHGWNAMSLYWPKYFPPIPLDFDFRTLLSERPWVYADEEFKKRTLFLTAACVAYFLPGSVSFSLWFFYVAHQVLKMVLGMTTGDATTPGQVDQQFGGLLAFAGIVIWLGRHHWKLIVAQAFRGERPGEPGGRYISYPFAFWGFLVCCLVMVGWLVAAGSGVGASIITVGITLLGFFLLARIVAETGLVHAGITLPITKPWQLIASTGWLRPVSVQSAYMSGMLETVHHDVRESFSVFASHAVKITDQAILDEQPKGQRSTGRVLVALFGMVLVIGFVVSLASMLWAEYTHANTFTRPPTVVNNYGVTWAVQFHVMDPTVNYANSNYHYSHSPTAHLFGGALMTLLLSFLRLRFVWWPFHPIGYIAIGSWPLGQLWFSLFVGWLLRTVVLRFGGAKLYVDGKTLVLGVIIGESVAAAFWLVMGFLLNSMNLEYRQILILPG